PCNHRRILPGRAEGYAMEGDGFVNAPFVAFGTSTPATGGLCATASGLVRWTHLLHSGKVVSPASLQLMTTRAVTTRGDTVSYGFGLRIHNFNPGQGRVISHGGSRPGYSAYLTHYPVLGLTVAVLGNTSEMSAGSVEEAVVRSLLGATLPDRPISAAELARLEGVYALENGGEVRVFGMNGLLMARLQGDATTHLMNQGNGVFIPDLSTSSRFTFPTEGGRAETVVVRIGPREMRGTRKQE
ncbi:MAG TPA: serine hydrolase domain-containing protein, partial [Rhodothermales bacterium]|nr:serine hydrolase domain-containing protein [Rhodothermales bacterium]